MSHPVDPSDADDVNTPAGTPAPTAAPDSTNALPEPRPRPSWGQPGPSEPSVSTSSVVPSTPEDTSGGAYSPPTPRSYGQPGAASPAATPPPYGQPGYGAGDPSTPRGGSQPYGQGSQPYGQGAPDQGNQPSQPSYNPPQYGQPGQPPYGQQNQPPQGGWQQPGWSAQPGQQYGAQQQHDSTQGWQQPSWGPTPAQYGQDMGRQEQRFAQAYGEKPRTGLSVTALVLGILTLLVSWAPLGSYAAIVLGILAIIFGIIGLRRAGRGMAIAGITIGGIGLVVAVLFSIFYTRLFVDIVDVATSCADQVGSSQGPAFEQCVNDRAPEYDPFN